MASILLITRHGEFTEDLKKKYQVTESSSGKEATDLLQHTSVDIVILDSIALRTPGDRVARALKAEFPVLPLIHFHPGEKGAAESPADMILMKPFSMRKINSTISRLLTPHAAVPTMPAQTVLPVLTCGPFAVDLTRRLLIANGQEQPLTPKLASLVEFFFSHPGETLDRRMLMEKVWHTDYIGDTRTLDVHVRWIRRAIEHDPGRPRYLLTVRGIGYRLEVPSTNGYHSL